MSRLGSGKGVLIAGIIVALGFGLVAVVSSTLQTNANTWYSTQRTLLDNQLAAGSLTPGEYGEQAFQLDQTRDWMIAQYYMLAPIAKGGVFFGMLLIFLGFVTLATGGQVDEQTKRALLTIAGVMLLVLFILFTGSLDISIN